MQNESLILDMVEWIDSRPRTYTEVMDAWRTSCPRLSVWEDAVDAQLVVRRHSPDSGELMVYATDTGRTFLRDRRSNAA